jgi:transposase
LIQGLGQPVGGQVQDANLFGFNDAQWTKIVPHLPVNQPGAARKDDRRILSWSYREKKIRHDKKACKNRNAVERCFRWLKDFRRIATRDDKLAQNFFSALCFAATLDYWI